MEAEHRAAASFVLCIERDPHDISHRHSISKSALATKKPFLEKSDRHYSPQWPSRFHEMTFKDDAKNKTGAFLSDSLEMFEHMFKQATQELKIRRRPKPVVQKPRPAPADGTPVPKEEKPKPAARTERLGSSPKPHEKAKRTPPAKTKPTPARRKGKGSRGLKVSLLMVLLLVLAAFLTNYFAIVDLTAIPHLLGLGPKPFVQAPIPRKQAAKPSQKPVTSPMPSQPRENAPDPSHAPAATPPSEVSKGGEPVGLETPATSAQPNADKQRIQKKTPSPSTTEQPEPPEAAATQAPQPVPARTQASTKKGAPEAASSQLRPQYPYSIYLGSFKTPEAVKKALFDYQGKGFSAYWAKVDLGDKGVWFRVFAGHFRTKEEAENDIRDRHIRGATPGITKYANLIGIYGSDKEMEDQKRAMGAAGFYPYVIKAPDGKSILYSGAFDRKDYAEKEWSALASKGIRSEVVER